MMTETRSMNPGDWEQVRRIYLEGLATGQATFETDAPSWERLAVILEHPPQ